MSHFIHGKVKLVLGKTLFVTYTDDLMRQYNIEKLEVRCKKQLLCLIFALSKDTSNVEPTHENTVVTRGPKKVKLISDFTSITRVHNSPLYRGIAVWDKLSEDIQRSDTKLQFKCAIKKLNL